MVSLGNTSPEKGSQGEDRGLWSGKEYFDYVGKINLRFFSMAAHRIKK